jgi:uncharacterized membrane protein YphA (DoxX/SURF4 family)
MAMLSLFPQLLFLAPLSDTILRIAAGGVFIYLAYFHYENRRAASTELSRFIGGASVILPFYALIELILGAALVAGVGTQLAALVGCIIALKILLVRKVLRELRPLPALTYFLVAAICLALVFSGAGAFAFDLPL